MRLDEAIYQYLIAQSDLTALVGYNIYPDVLPQKVNYPAIAFEQISGQRVLAFGNDTNYIHPVVRFNCYADSFDEARTVGEKLRSAMQNLIGTMSSLTNVTVMLVSESDNYNYDVDRYVDEMEFEIWHDEA